MKRPVYQVLALLVCICMLTAGCQSTPAATIAPAANPTEAPAATTSAPVAVEYTGGAIKSFPYTGDPITIVYSSSIETISKAYADNMDCAVYKAFKTKIGNIDFQYVFNGDEEAMKIMLSTGDMPFDVFDFWNCMGTGRDYGPVGSLLELSQYKDIMPNLTAVGDQYPKFRSGLMDDEKYYGFGIAMNLETEYFFPHNGWRFNGYYLSALNAQVPKTIDDFYAYCKAAKEYNPAAYPFMMTYDAYLSTFMGMYGAKSDFYYNWDTKAWEYGLTTAPDKVYSALEMMNKFYSEKLILQDFMTISQEQVAALMGSTDGFAATPWSPAPPNAEEEYIAERKATSDTYDLLFSEPIREEGVPYKPGPMAWAGDASWFGTFINAKTEDPAMVCSVVDFLYSDDIRTLSAYGIEGETYDLVDGIPMFKDEITTPANLAGTVDAFEKFGLCSIKDSLTGLVGMTCGRPPVGWHWNVYLNDYSKKLVEPQIEAAKQNIPEEQRRSISTNDLAISEAENETIMAIKTPLDTLVQSELIKFAVGERKLSEWDAFLEDVKKYNIQACLDIYNLKELPD